MRPLDAPAYGRGGRRKPRLRTAVWLMTIDSTDVPLQSEGVASLGRSRAKNRPASGYPDDLALTILSSSIADSGLTDPARRGAHSDHLHQYRIAGRLQQACTEPRLGGLPSILSRSHPVTAPDSSPTVAHKPCGKSRIRSNSAVRGRADHIRPQTLRGGQSLATLGGCMSVIAHPTVAAS